MKGPDWRPRVDDTLTIRPCDFRMSGSMAFVMRMLPNRLALATCDMQISCSINDADFLEKSPLDAT